MAKTKLIEVHLAAMTRVVWDGLVEVPEHFTPAEIEDVVDKIYDLVDGGDFQEDLHYWEKGSCYASPAALEDEEQKELAFRVDTQMNIERATDIWICPDCEQTCEAQIPGDSESNPPCPQCHVPMELCRPGSDRSYSDVVRDGRFE